MKIEKKTINMSEMILKVLFGISCISIKIGIPITRWKKITTCMIEKVPGVSRLDKLRVIHILR
jgi:hypothetical protein